MLRVSACSGLMLALLLGAFAHAAPEIPAATFAALPQVSDVQLSPDAQLVAWCDNSGPDAKVVIFDLAAKAFRRTLSIDPKMMLRSLVWSDDGTLLVNLSEVRKYPGVPPYEYFRTLAVDVRSGDSRMLLMGGGTARYLVTGATLISSHAGQPHTVIMATMDYSRNDAVATPIGTRLTGGRAELGWVAELFQVDTRTGMGTIIGRGGAFTDGWVVDSQGQPVARSVWKPEQKQFSIEVRSGKDWKPIYKRDGQPLVLWSVSPDGKTAIATGPRSDGRIGIWAIALDGSGMKDLLSDPAADVLRVLSDSYSGAPTAARLSGPDPRYLWIDSAAKLRFESVEHAFPGRNIAISSRSEDGSRLVVQVQDSSHPPVYYLVDFKSHRADIIGEAYPALDNARLGTVRSITYKARDGTTIPAYLTLPPGAAPRDLRMVVLPHGGPRDRDYPVFNWFAQFLASRGYAVLQPQFRGSAGFGGTFERAGLRQWGGSMQDDVTDGVRAMISQGIADPHRICIVGAGYGGYVALAGVAFTPGLYACAISINGIADLPGFLSYQQERDARGKQADNAVAWVREVGTPLDRNVMDHSPVNAAADITSPVLLLHATDDAEVRFSQSEAMANALRDQGKRVTLIKLPGDDDSLARSETRLTVLQDMELFLHDYLN